MRLALCLLAATGCGRLGFGERIAPDGGGSGDGGADGSTDAGPQPDADAIHDEDGDGVPDVDDKCPWIAGDQSDIDGDGVGDACDPDPSLPNHIAIFETFAHGIPGGWTTLGAATWATTGGGDLLATYTDLNASVMVLPGTLAPPYAISTAVVIDTDSTDSTNYTLSIVDTLDTGTVDSEKCGMVTNPNGLAIGHEMAGNTVEAVTQAWGDSMVVGAEYTLVMRHEGGNVGCDADDTNDATAAGRFSVDAVEYRAGPGSLGLRTRNQTVRFHYFALVTQP